MVNHKYKIGDVAVLANFNTRYGKNSIPDCNWGHECVVFDIDPYWRSDDDGGAYHVITKDGRERHVVGTMLSDTSGPW